VVVEATGEEREARNDWVLRQIRAYARERMDLYNVPVRINVVDQIAYSARFKKVLR
jgi:hypothetical protein